MFAPQLRHFRNCVGLNLRRPHLLRAVEAYWKRWLHRTMRTIGEQILRPTQAQISQKIDPTRNAGRAVDKTNPNTRTWGGFTKDNIAKFFALSAYPQAKPS